MDLRYSANKILSVTLVVNLTGLPAMSWALPGNGQVQSGNINIGNSGNVTTIDQTTQYGAINWDSFNIGAGESVIFNQPGSSSVTLNNILDANPSAIMGSISANGQVFLSNPNGFIFGAGSSVNVGSLMATTAIIDSFDANTGAIVFSGNGSGTIHAMGDIEASDGYIGFFAPEIINSGSLQADAGSIALSTETNGTLYLPGFAGVGFNIDDLSSTDARSITHEGEISADGGQIIISSDAYDSALQSAINTTGMIDVSISGNGDGGNIQILAANGSIEQSGVIQANAGSNGDGGEILIIAEQNLKSSGQLQAKGGTVSGDGGFIETSAHVADINQVRVDTRAANGETGTWLIDPDHYVINDSGSGSAADTSYMSTSSIATNLGTTDVDVVSDVSITVEDAINYSGANAGTLTLQSGAVNINADINLGENGILDVLANSVSVDASEGNNIAVTASQVSFNNSDPATVINTTLGSNLTFNIADSFDLSDTNILGQGSFSLTINSQGSNIATGTMGQTRDLQSLTVSGVDTLNLTANLQTFSGGIDIEAGTININNTIELSDSTGDIRLAGDVVGNGNDLTIDTTFGNIETDAISGVNDLTIAASSGTMQMNGDIAITGALDFNEMPDIESTSDLNISADTVLMGNTSISTSGDLSITSNSGLESMQLGNTEAQTLTITASGLDLFGDLTADTGIAGSLDLSAAGLVELQSDAVLTGDLLYTTIESSASDLHSLAINYGNNDFTLQNIGTNIGFASFSLTGNGNLTIASGGMPIVHGAQGISFLGNQNLLLSEDFLIDTSAFNGAINISGLTINGENALILNAGSGDISLGTLGNETALTGLTTTTTGSLNLYGDLNILVDALDFSSVSSVMLFNDMAFGSAEAPLASLNFGEATIDGTFNLTIHSTEFTSGAIGENIALQDVTLNMAGADYNLSQNIRAAGNIDITANLIEQNADITSSGGDISLTAAAGINMAPTSTISATLGDVTLISDTADIQLARVTAQDSINVEATAGSILNAIDDYNSDDDTSINLTANAVNLTAGVDIGESIASPIVVSAGPNGTISADAPGSIFIANIDNAATNFDALVSDITRISNRASADAINQINTPTYEMVIGDDDSRVYSPEWYAEDDDNEGSSSPRIYHDRRGWRLGNP